MSDVAELAPIAAAPVETYWFDEAAAASAVAFFPRFLCFTKDKWAGRPFHLEPWQIKIVREAFGWKRANGTRRYRRVIVFVPRKNGKTELAAGVGLLMLVGDGISGPEVYAIAKDKNQASIVFGKASQMVAMSKSLAAQLAVFKTSIYCAELQGVFKPLTGNAEGKHGLNASGIVGDEVHEWPDASLYTTVHQSEGAREEPLEFLISTAGVRGHGYGWELWEEAKSIQSGAAPQDDTLVVIYAADPEDDWREEATWAKANPNLGVSVSIDYLRAECRKAQNNARLENDFKRYHLDLWTNQVVRWIQLEQWDLCARRNWLDESSLVGRRCYVGVDLASTADIAAAVYLFPPDDAEGTFDVVCRFFVPSERVAERVRRDRVPYDRWIAQGALIATPGNVLDYEFIITQLETDGASFNIQLLGMDRWNSTHFSTRLVDRGFDADRLVAVGQGYGSMSEPCKTLERLVLSQRFDHAGQPVLRWMAENVAITQDSAGNIKPAKDKSSEKIDGIAAAADAIFVHLNGEPESESVYETRGLAEVYL